MAFKWDTEYAPGGGRCGISIKNYKYDWCNVIPPRSFPAAPYFYVHNSIRKRGKNTWNDENERIENERILAYNISF